MRLHLLSVVRCLAITAALTSCSSTDTPPAAPLTPSITLSVPQVNVSLAQAATQQITVNVSQANAATPLTLSITGLPVGVTGAFSPVANGSCTLTLTAAPDAAPGTSTPVIHASATGAAEQTAQLALTVTVTGTFSISASTSSLQAAQGDAPTVTVSVNRAGGFSGNVSLSVSGAPAGMTTQFAPASTTGNSSTLTLMIAANTTPGTYPLTLTASTPGLSNQTANLSLQVLAATALSMRFCGSGIPTWLAFQNEGGIWKRVTGNGDTFAFNATNKVRVMYVILRPGGGDDVTVLQTSAAEIQQRTPDCISVGNVSVNGTASGLTGTQGALVSIGAKRDTLTPSKTSYQVNSATTPLDVVAVRSTVATPAGGFPNSTPDQIILRRNLSVASGATLQPLVFGGTEAFAPTTRVLTMPSPKQLDVFIRTSNGTLGQLYFNQSPQFLTSTMYLVPAAQMAPGDMHIIRAASTETGIEWGVTAAFVAPADQSLPSFVTGWQSSSCGEDARTPYYMLSCTISPISGYDAGAEAFLDQPATSRSLRLVTTVGFYGAVPSVWDVTTPNVATVTGFDPVWMLSVSQPFSNRTSLYSGRPALRLGSALIDGDLFKYITVIGSTTP